MLTSFSDRERILDALDAGAVGYLLKDAEPEELIARHPRRGARASRRSTRGPRARCSPRAPRRAGPAELTDARARGAGLVGEGLPNKLIARELGISEKTVKAHLTRVFATIGVTDRTQAALWATRHGVQALTTGRSSVPFIPAALWLGIGQ